MASIDANWRITLEPEDVIALSQGSGVDAWPDEKDGGQPIAIKVTAPCDIEDAAFMKWLDDQNAMSVRLIEFCKGWWNAITRVKGNVKLMSDVSVMRKAELLSAMYNELGEVLHELGMLEDDDVYRAQDDD